MRLMRLNAGVSLIVDVQLRYHLSLLSLGQTRHCLSRGYLSQHMMGLFPVKQHLLLYLSLVKRECGVVVSKDKGW